MLYSKLIPLLAGNCSFQEQHERQCGALYASMMQSDNMLVHNMARRAMYNVLGTLGMNRVILRHKFGLPQENGVFNYQYMVCEEDRHRANLIGELVQVRDGQLHLHMSQCEVCTFMEYVCMM